MTPRRRLWLLVLATYVAGRLLARTVVLGSWALDGALAAQLLVVPVLEIIALEIAARVLWKGRL